MTQYLETGFNPAVDISSAAMLASYTSDTDRLVLVQILLDGVAGGGDYIFYASLTLDGDVTEYILLPKTTGAAAAGEVDIGGQSIMIPMRDGDVLTIYADGLAGDLAVESTVRFFDVATCCPLGTGPYTFTYTVTNSVTGLPIAGAHVIVSTDVAGANVIAAGYTNVAGQVVFYFEAGTYYFWVYHPGFTGALPDIEVVP